MRAAISARRARTRSEAQPPATKVTRYCRLSRLSAPLSVPIVSQNTKASPSPLRLKQG
jgi:hypothetical protein